jgi:hypothetical protein
MADITVQVSSAGLTAYGADAYGYGSFGGNATPIGQVSNCTSLLSNRLGWTYTWGSATHGVILLMQVTPSNRYTISISTSMMLAAFPLTRMGW